MQPGRREDAPPPAQGPGPGRPPGDGGASGGHPPARGRWGLAFSLLRVPPELDPTDPGRGPERGWTHRGLALRTPAVPPPFVSPSLSLFHRLSTARFYC